MRCLTVQQPWAWAIMHGGKTIENRTQLWSYRGKLAIHAGARASDRGLYDPRILEAFTASPLDSRDRWTTLQSDMMRRLEFAAILGVADLVDVHPDAGCCRPWGESAYIEHGGRHRQHITHLVLENPQPLAEPIPYRGALGLWIPPPDITEHLESALKSPEQHRQDALYGTGSRRSG